ncbi:MAG: hypothetical protein KF778_05990 [Rhodocyclaceae bacterium]|nr:hypothetical protein [Rhodocyclaceae bacterium]MBX3667936.1 hypothetical protein [Rhodocyclaceae bacterium]
MLKIRKAQMRALEHAVTAEFAEQLATHLFDFAPQHCRALGRAGVVAIARAGIQRARSHGFEARGEVKLYVELMFLFGSAFDSDPQYHWLHALLDAEGDRPAARADALHAATMDYIEKVAGLDRRAYRESMERAQQLDFERLAPDLDAHAVGMRYFRHVSPMKLLYVGEPALSALIAHAVDCARGLGAATSASAFRLAALMFVLGHGVLDDAQYPWVAELLAGGDGLSPDARIARIPPRAFAYLKAAMRGTEV